MTSGRRQLTVHPRVWEHSRFLGEMGTGPPLQIGFFTFLYDLPRWPRSRLLPRKYETWGICTRRAGKLYRARPRLYRRRFLQVNMRWKALAEIYTMHSFAPFSSLNFFVKLLRNFRHFFHNFCYFSVIFLDFFEILLKFCRNFWKFHGNPLNLQISMNFRGCRTKPGPKCGKKPSAARLSSPYVALRFWWP